MSFFSLNKTTTTRTEYDYRQNNNHHDNYAHFIIHKITHLNNGTRKMLTKMVNLSIHFYENIKPIEKLAQYTLHIGSQKINVEKPN